MEYIQITSALSLTFSIRSCFSSVDMEASMVAVTMPQVGQQDLFIISRMALFSSFSLSSSAFNNEFSCRSCIACKIRNIRVKFTPTTYFEPTRR